MTTALTQTDLENILVKGDLASLNAEQRTHYYQELCSALGLNPLTRPLQYITLQGKLTLYATKGATEQIAARDGVSIEIVEAKQFEGDIYSVHVRAKSSNGRFADATGVVSLTDGRSGQRLMGEALANAYMKAETKASRRAVLRIAGLGMLDETEVGTIPGAVRVDNPVERVAPPMREPRALPEQRRNGKSNMDKFRDWVKEQGMTDEDVLHVIGGEVLDAPTLKEAMQRMNISGVGELQEALYTLWYDTDSETANEEQEVFI